MRQAKSRRGRRASLHVLRNEARNRLRHELILCDGRPYDDATRGLPHRDYNLLNARIDLFIGNRYPSLNVGSIPGSSGDDPELLDDGADLPAGVTFNRAGGDDT